jgi:hypothetical protein
MKRAHMQKGEDSKRLKKQHRAKEAADWAEMGPGRPAPAGRPINFEAQSAPPLT